MPSLYDFFPWWQPAALAAVVKVPAPREEREAVQRWEGEGGNIE